MPSLLLHGESSDYPGDGSNGRGGGVAVVHPGMCVDEMHFWTHLSRSSWDRASWLVTTGSEPVSRWYATTAARVARRGPLTNGYLSTNYSVHVHVLRTTIHTPHYYMELDGRTQPPPPVDDATPIENGLRSRSRDGDPPLPVTIPEETGCVAARQEREREGGGEERRIGLVTAATAFRSLAPTLIVQRSCRRAN